MTYVNIGFTLNVITLTTDYKYFQGSNDSCFCDTCCSAICPFVSLNNNCFLSAISCDRFNKNNEKQVETKDPFTNKINNSF